MSALTSLLVRDQKVPVRKIEEAIQRQVIAGGGLDTVLLELGALPENEMAAYCAATHGMLSATREACMGASRDVIRIVPGEVAERHRLVPLAASARVLAIAVSSPLTMEVDQQLGFLLGMELEQHVTTEVRLAAALRHHYGVETTPRLARLATKLEPLDAGVAPLVAPASDNVSTRPERAGSRTQAHPTNEAVALHEGPSTKRFGTLGEPSRSNASVGVSRVVGVQGSVPVTAPYSVAPGVQDEAAPASEPPPAREPAPTNASKAALSTPPPAARRPSQPRGELLAKHRGPLTARRSAELLKSAETRDDILEIAFAFLRQFFDAAGLFVVQDGRAEGLDLAGRDVDLTRFMGLSVDLREPSSLALVHEGIVPAITHLDASPVDRHVRDFVGGRDVMPALLVPIAIRQRVVLVFYGDRSGEAFGLVDVPEAVAFAPRVSEAFLQLIVRRKLRTSSAGALSSPGSQSSPSQSPSQSAPVSQPPVSQPPASQTPASQSSATAPARGPTTTPGHSVAPSETTDETDERPRVKGWSSAPTPPKGRRAFTPAPERGWTEADREKPTREFESAPPPRASFAPVLQLDSPLPPPPSRERPRKRSEAFELLGVPRGAPPPPEPGAQPMVTPSDPPTPPDDDDEPELIYDEPAEVEEPEASVGAYAIRGGRSEVIGPAGRRRDPRRVDARAIQAEVLDVPIAVADVPAHEPSDEPRRSRVSLTDSSETPSVIIEMGDVTETAVEDLRYAGPDGADAAVSSVVQQGEAALPVLVREFPGPLWFDRTHPHRRLPRGRDVSSIARAMVAFHDLAVPYVASLLDRDDANHRFYAVLLASEFSHPKLVPPLGRRIFDSDEGVAALAIDVIRGLTPFARELHDVIETVRSEARVPRRPIPHRRRAIRALGELRDAGSLDMLVKLMEHESDLAPAAHHSLVSITRQDFGTSARRWAEWIAEHGAQHRIEWLIDALLHPDEKMRTLAGDELKHLTQEYYGYHPALPRRDREIAQRKYEAWWTSEGRRRFG